MVAIKMLLLLLLANGTPVLAKKLMGRRLAYPVDGGRPFRDGRPWLGPSKTWRGIVLSILVTAIVAGVLGYSLQFGAQFALAAMAGDLLSSFIKRRLGLAPSSMAPGLDQVPESLLPVLWAWKILGLDLPAVILVVVAFVFGEIVLSRLLFRLNVRERPY